MGFLNLFLHSCCHFEGGDSLIGFALEGYCRCCFLLRNRYLRNLEICQKTCIPEPFCGGVQGMMGKKSLLFNSLWNSLLRIIFGNIDFFSLLNEKKVVLLHPHLRNREVFKSW